MESMETDTATPSSKEPNSKTLNNPGTATRAGSKRKLDGGSKVDTRSKKNKSK